MRVDAQVLCMIPCGKVLRSVKRAYRREEEETWEYRLKDHKWMRPAMRAASKQFRQEMDAIEPGFTMNKKVHLSLTDTTGSASARKNRHGNSRRHAERRERHGATAWERSCT